VPISPKHGSRYLRQELPDLDTIDRAKNDRVSGKTGRFRNGLATL